MKKITNIGEVKIYDEEYVLKKEAPKEELYKYLESRDFHNYIPLIEREGNYNKYEYKFDYSMNYEQKCNDIIRIISKLHNKTSFNRQIDKDKNKEIFNNIRGYLKHLNEYYLDILNSYEKVNYPSPSQLLFMTNYTKLKQIIEFSDSQIIEWYNLVKDNNKERVVLINGNLEVNHLINSDNEYIISWDKARFESPILEIINFYKKEWEYIEFSNILSYYIEHTKLTEQEKKLLFSNITIPPKIKLSNKEYENVIIIRKLFDYIYKTEELIRPYYSIKDKE